MTTAFQLGLPIDIPWTKVCVTEDMMDRVVCDDVLPPKWHSSIAIFKYRPDDDFQKYPDYDITYLKATVTITGYQPLEDEIQGEIDWDGVDVTSVEGVTELLSSYYPCTGAILQMVVGPHGDSDNTALDRYPFFLDFEPKKRELYEMATDTKERSSRSIESINVGKSGGTTKSLEVLDVDMGGSTSFGAQGQYAGTGGGFTYSSSNQGQWGTKSVNTQDSQTTRTTEVGTERRETQSFTTQLSQMYHLLDSYHVGTNRAVFFVQPRPHVLEEPSGFVRGPRKVEGIQEFFLVVAAPKDAPDYCISARLDTAHLAETDILDYEYRSEVTDLATAAAHVPTRNDTPDGTTTREACFLACWDVTYLCYRTHAVDDVVYNAPTGFGITSTSDVVNQSDAHGSTGVTVSPDRRVVTVHAEASGHICFEDSGVCVDCPDEVDKWAGFARRQVQVQLRSEEPIRKVGTRTSLVITTRGLCCCDRGPDKRWLNKGISVVDLPPGLAVLPASRAVGAVGRTTAALKAVRGARPEEGAGLVAAEDQDCGCGDCEGCGDQEPMTAASSVVRANAISDAIRDELTKHVTSRRLRTASSSFVETDLFAKQVEGVLSRSRRGRDLLAQPVTLPKDVAKAVADRLHRKPGELTQKDLLRFQVGDIARESGRPAADIRRLKLGSLGMTLRDGDKLGGNRDTDAPPARPRKDDDDTSSAE
ncbi:hypothetical protein [Nocardioides terrigena]|uniref:hypothetical protein n=1 Tax=Nocardioides terrigena TaxID=424797 RepID=UPI00131EFD82|nr:hypothetical protein [Nocardioides terrigena]